ncbi:hypothetical protein Droror1_Dr00028045 [Drosera rotundifolia]
MAMGERCGDGSDDGGERRRRREEELQSEAAGELWEHLVFSEKGEATWLHEDGWIPRDRTAMTMNEGMTSAIDEDDERIADEDYQGHEFVGGDIQNDQQSCQGEFVTSSGQPFVGMIAIQKANCYHKEGHQASCSYGDNSYMLLFGFVQILMSQIPNFHNMEWLSAVAAIMSFSYAFISLGLGVAKLIGNGVIKGTIGGVAAASTTKKLTLVFQALGDIAFAYPCSIIVLEIQVFRLLCIFLLEPTIDFQFLLNLTLWNEKNNAGYLEVASTRKPNHEDCFFDFHPNHHLLLHVLRVLWICCLQR